MNSITQISVFDYSEIENLGDLERLKIFFENIEDEKLCQAIEKERKNGRIDRDYMFNDHFIRGQKKMDLMLTLTFVVMLTIAKGHIKNKEKNIRSLVA